MRPDQNLFRTSQLDRLPFVDPEVTVEELMLRLEALEWRAQIVGPKGSGKTALLLAIQDHLPRYGLFALRLRTNTQLGGDAPREDPCQTVLLVDDAVTAKKGFDVLGRSVQRRYAGVILTAHTPLKRVRLLHTCRPSPEILDLLLDRLCGERAPEYRALAQDLFIQERGNFHNIFLRLYDEAARRAHREEPSC